MAMSKKDAMKKPGLQRIKDKKKPGMKGEMKKTPGMSTRPKPGGPVKPKPIKRGR